MRDPKRIDLVLAKVKELWETVPDWRFGQLVHNVKERGDIFFTEDEEWLELIQRMIDENKS